MRNSVPTSTKDFLPPYPHSFAIGPAGPNDPFGGRGQRYLCVRCRYAFVVKGRKIVVLDERDLPMTGNDALQRLATFADGPCLARSAAVPDRMRKVVSNGRLAHA